jgi:glycosyltransferase involved in cell wall biosynthesis
MSSDILLSIVTTTYKRDALLIECLHSILDSYLNYRKTNLNFSLEIVITDDDADADRNRLIGYIRTLQDHGIKVVYHVNQVNLGDYFNRYNGVMLASGKWIKFVDDDDLVYPWCIGTIVDCLQKSQKETNVLFFYPRDNTKHLMSPVVLKGEEIFRFHYLEYGIFHSAMVNSVFRREEVIELGGFQFKRFYGDFQFYHDMALKGQFEIYPIEIGWYRVHQGQESPKNRKIANRIRFNYLLYSVNFLLSHNFSVKYFSILRSNAFSFFKGALKCKDTYLAFHSMRMYLLISRIIFGKRPRKERWVPYYQSMMTYNNNEIKTAH